MQTVKQTWNSELKTWNSKLGTRNLELGTQNLELKNTINFNISYSSIFTKNRNLGICITIFMAE